MATRNNVARLPMPARLEPTATRRTLMTNVRVYFYSLFNEANGKFRDFLASVGNADAITGNRLFDRYEAVGLIKAAAKQAGDPITVSAKPGDVYKCIVDLMRKNNLGLKLRRREYERLTHQQPAE